MSGSEPKVCASVLQHQQVPGYVVFGKGVVAPVRPCETAPFSRQEELTLKLVGASTPNWEKMSVLFLTGDPRDP